MGKELPASVLGHRGLECGGLRAVVDVIRFPEQDLLRVQLLRQGEVALGGFSGGNGRMVISYPRTTWQVNANHPSNLPSGAFLFASSRLCCSSPIAVFGLNRPHSGQARRHIPH
jgi:hypothetical protein